MHDSYDERNLYNNMYVYNLINDNMMYDEITTFYNSNTLFFKDNMMIIDKLLGYRMFGHFTYRNSIRQIQSDFDFFAELNIYLIDIIHKIRLNQPVNVKADISDKIDLIFDSIYKGFTKLDEIFTDYMYYIQGTKEICKLYLIFLIQIYKDNIGVPKSQFFGRLTFLNIGMPDDSKINIQSIKYGDKMSVPTYQKINYSPKNKILQYLNINEIYNISDKIIEYDYDYISQFNKLYNITIDRKFIYQDIDLYDSSFISIELNLDLKLNLKSKDEYSLYDDTIREYTYLYEIYCNYINYKNSPIYSKYKNKIEDNIINIKSNVLKLFNGTWERISDIQLCIAILILSDLKYFLFREHSNDDIPVILFNVITKDTKIFIGDFLFYKEEIMTILNDENDNKFERIIQCCNNPKDDIKWLNPLGINLLDNYYYYQGNKYTSVDYNKDATDARLALSRFGFSFFDIHEYLLLLKDHQDNSNEKFLLLIKKYEKCIEINLDINLYIDTNNCYIIDKNSRYKLLFNLNKKTCPFISLIPRISPYLCYIDNRNVYNIDIIISSSHKTTAHKMISDILYNPKKPKIINFKMFNMKIAPSNIFPLIDSYDLNDFNLLFDCYEENKIKLINNLNNLNSFNIERLDLKHINLSIQEIIKLLEIRYENPDEEILKKFLSDEFKSESEHIKEKFNAVSNSFISENRLCIGRKEVISDMYILRLIASLEMKIYDLTDRIVLDKNYTNFIMNNLKSFILIMEHNIVINLLKSMLPDNIKINCWDIQYMLTSLKSILFFNSKVMDNYFYEFEIIFLLQNNYFFKESQLDRYKQILGKLLNVNNPEPKLKLELHQFMMGKGKSSVFTPLLSFATLSLTKKIPTVITASHLVESTRKYTEFTEYIINKKVNIFSDFTAKKRWIEYTDKTLKTKLEEEKQFLINKIQDPTNINIIKDKNRLKEIKNIKIEDEINIIDEFDLHHNYLQSMFNYVQKEEKINEDIFLYVFNYVHHKLLHTFYSISTRNIPNINILNENLEIFYNIASTMEYNKHYGFSFLHFDDEKNNTYRLCSPFIRKNTPVKQSNFSSILLSLILTFKLYITDFKSKLQDFDYINLLNNQDILSELFPNLDMPDNNSIEFIKLTFDKLYLESKNINKILYNYLKIVNKNIIKYTTKQINLSFQDIISNTYNQFQVGYTGTISLKLNNYDDMEYQVFRDIIPDYDENIEIKLALTGYSCSTKYDNRVTIINNDDSVENNLKIIVDLLKDNPRGFVDLGGLFIREKNNDIAEKLKSLLPNNKIVFLSDEHEGLEYNNNNNNKHTKYVPEHNDNFYYYDQCHIVGSDLKQSRIGHIAIIIDEKTRYTDFAQAIFRFRKINRGTYLSIILISNKKIEKTNDDIYILLKNNEDIFNMNQINGIKYQFLKTLVRKKTRNYQEIDLKPEYLRLEKFNGRNIIDYINKNIYDINNIIKDDVKILSLYNELISIPDKNKLISLVVGSGLNTQMNQDIVQTIEQNQDQQSQIIINSETMIEILSKYKTNKNNCVLHNNCDLCKQNCFIKLFDTDDYMINNKTIYISYNLLSLVDDSLHYESVGNGNYYVFGTENTNSRFCYVEFDDMILIETEFVALNYYLYKVPVYNYVGKQLFPYIGSCSKLDIDMHFIKMIGIKYVNTNKDKQNIKIDLNKAVESLNPIGLVILSFCLILNEYRYKLSLELQNRMKTIATFKELEQPVKMGLKHNINESIEHIYYYMGYNINYKNYFYFFEIKNEWITLPFQKQKVQLTIKQKQQQHMIELDIKAQQKREQQQQQQQALKINLKNQQKAQQKAQQMQQKQAIKAQQKLWKTIHYGGEDIIHSDSLNKYLKYKNKYLRLKHKMMIE